MLVKSDIKILNYVYRHSRKGLTYHDLYMRYSKKQIDHLSDYLEDNRIIEYDDEGLEINQDTDYIPVFLSYNGLAEVESRQWFDLKFVLLQILLPISIAIITTALTRALWPCR